MHVWGIAGTVQVMLSLTETFTIEQYVDFGELADWTSCDVIKGHIWQFTKGLCKTGVRL